ncbi:hypothetical protein N2152v2_006794 [Parachlorella kessleri]
MRALATSVLLVLASTFTSLAAKLAYQLKGTGRDGELNYFEKPWAMTTVLFLGMTSCLPLAMLLEYRQRRQQKTADEEDTLSPLLSECVAQPIAPAQQRSSFVLCIPAAFDLVATALMNIGLLSLRVSVYQMLRGASELVFTRLFAALLLKRRPTPLHLAGTFLSVAGIAVVGVASELYGGSSEPGSAVSQKEMLWGMGLVILSQGVQVAQFRYEDYYMADLNMHPLRMVGLEGVFGTLGMLGLVLPLAQRLPGEEGRGFHEDSLDTLQMVRSSPAILALLLGDIVALLVYNVAGMSVLNRLGSLFRTLLETSRTLLVWLGALLLFYCLGRPSAAGPLGEPWFLVLVGGTLTYSKGDEARLQEQQEEEEELFGGGPEEESPLVDAVEGGQQHPPALQRQESLPPQLARVPRSVPIVVAATSIKSSMNLSAFNLPRPLVDREADRVGGLSTTPRPHYAFIRPRCAGSSRAPLQREPPALLDGARPLPLGAPGGLA